MLMHLVALVVLGRHLLNFECPKEKHGMENAHQGRATLGGI